MSYLTLPKGIPDFTKAVISLWFRVPQESIDKARAAAASADMLAGIIPLVAMGQKGLDEAPPTWRRDQVLNFETSGQTAASGGTNDTETEVFGPCPEHGTSSVHCKTTIRVGIGAYFTPIENSRFYTEVTTYFPTGEPNPPADPTFIGVDCRGGGEPRLYVNFETNQQPVVSGYSFNKTITMGEFVPVSPEEMTVAYEQGTVVTEGCSVGVLPIPFYDVVTTGAIVSVRYPPVSLSHGEESFTDISELFFNGTGAVYSDEIKVTPDRWHHVLVSVDLKTIQTHGSEDSPATAVNVDSAAQLFVALDDVNYIGSELSSAWPDGSDDPNAVITAGAKKVAVDAGAGAVYKLEDPKVPSGNEPIGFPATPDFVDNIYRIELAEFQMWTGVTFDTGAGTFRRLFIDEEGEPVKPEEAEQRLGRPHIMLHRSSKWKKGRNTGSTGETADGELIPAGQFAPVGGIEKWKPDPSLHGDQG